MLAEQKKILNGATKKNLRSHQSDQPFERKKSVRDSESLPVVQQQTHIRPISWSKTIRDSEGRTLIGRDLSWDVLSLNLSSGKHFKHQHFFSKLPFL